MPIIKILSADQAHKIAAGEVVERPASIVKELLENSLDAGASTISLAIEDGGKQFIRIVDNGCGMDSTDAQTCFIKHATSKVSSIDELETVRTYGFRGEALTSIAAIASVTLRTKQQGAIEGTCVQVAHSTIESISSTACASGTDITIEKLFDAIPARKKFLKKRETEFRHIHQLFQAYCLAYPEIHFKLISEHTVLENHAGISTLRERFTQLFEHELAAQMIDIQADDEQGRVQISGIISNHQRSRFDRDAIFLFVNNRWIKNPHLSKALLKGYNNVLPSGKFPLACIKITVPPATVDINIHPRKEEVRFLNPRVIEALLEQTVRTALERAITEHIKRPVSFNPVSTHWQTNQSFGTIPSSVKKPDHFVPFDFDAAVNAYQHRQLSPPPSLPELGATGAPSITAFPFLQQSTAITQEEPFRIIGQYANTYILIEKDDGLFLVDQHAAHERILYEQFARRFESLAPIPLLFPICVSLLPAVIEAVNPYLPLLAEYGISTQQFGTHQLMVTAAPVHLKSANMQELIETFHEYVLETDHTNHDAMMKLLHEKLRAQMACKAAVKAGDTLSHVQMEQLLEDLQKTENRFSCPHGRPTGWLISLNDIERKFKRKL